MVKYNLIDRKLCVHGVLGDRKYVTLNHSYWGDDRRGAFSGEGSLERGSIHQTEICSDRVGISV